MDTTPACIECDTVVPKLIRGLCRPCYGRLWRRGLLQPLLPVGVHSLTCVDKEARTAICTICGPTRVRIRNGNRGAECKAVGARRHPTPGQRRQQKYRLTRDELDELIASANGRCQICNQAESLVVDHCHETLRVRGMLCHRCNVALGWMSDSAERLRAAADYLEA